MVNLNRRNIVIAEPSRNLRLLGRNALSGNWRVAIVSVFVFTLIVSVIPSVLNALFGVNLTDIIDSGNTMGMDANMYSLYYSMMPTYCPISGIYIILVYGPMTLGLSLFFLAMFRRQIVEVSDIFLGFEKFGKAVSLIIFQYIFIFLWSLLFVIPGIIAAIRYSQAFFILADDPEKDIRQCMNESKMMMKGNKMKYFCMNLSFIGWMLLATIPASIVVGIGDLLALDGLASAVVSIISGLFAIPVTVYMFSTQAGFYEILAGHLIKSTEPAPLDDIIGGSEATYAEFESKNSETDAESESTPANEPKMEVERVNVADVMEDAGDDKKKEE